MSMELLTQIGAILCPFVFFMYIRASGTAKQMESELNREIEAKRSKNRIQDLEKELKEKTSCIKVMASQISEKEKKCCPHNT